MTDLQQHRERQDGAALIILDMVSPLDFEDAERLMQPAVSAAEAIADLRGQADALEVPTIYVNDNYGEWYAERSRIVAHSRKKHGGEILRHIAPRSRDYFIIKPQFSGFYGTALSVLLLKLEVRRLVLTGMATDICVLFTAGDAHMRGFGLWTPGDAVASAPKTHGLAALKIMQKSMEAEVRPTTKLKLRDWLERA
jgi:nicotinamidase-related amidase